MCAAALTGVVWAGTYATFTDSGTAGSAFTAGTVDLLISGETDDAYAFTSIEMSNMKPGDVSFAPLTIRNDGTLGFTYTMSTSATNADSKGLADQMRLEARVVAGTCDTVSFAASVTTVVPDGALSAAAISSRSLSSATEEVLCYKASLPAGANDSYQGATTTATFTFSATQS